MSKKAEFSYEHPIISPASLEGVREVFSEIEYLPAIVYKNACRYRNLRTIQDEDNNKIHHESWNQQAIKLSTEDQYFTVTNYEKDRLDIIANKYYGTPRFWWVIAIANYLMDPFDVPVGTVLRIPPKENLYMSGGVLSG